MRDPWKRLARRSVAHTKIFELFAEQYLSPRTGKPCDAVVLDAADWVNVVALTAERQVVMVRQYRYGSGAYTLEIPGGMVDSGETPPQAAARELREETGYVAARWTSLGHSAPNPAFLRNRLHCFLAEGCHAAHAQSQDPGEDIEVELWPLDKVDGWIASGEVDHALVQVAFQKLTLLRAGHRLG